MLSFGLFILVNAVLFIRPAELIPALEDLPLYEVAILAAIAAAASHMLRQLSTASLASRPVTVFVLGLLAAVVLSHLAELAIGAATDSGFLFVKIVLFYLLIVANVQTLSRLRVFLLCLGGLMVCQVGLGLLVYFEYLDLDALKPFAQAEYDGDTGDVTVLPRLCGAGIFNDPNDLCVLLALGLILVLYLLADCPTRRIRFAYLVSLGVFAVAVPLTHSRGGLLAVMAGLSVLAAEWLGVKRAFVILGVLVPVLFLEVGGRMTQFDLENSGDTSQHRMRLWSEGLMMLRSAPLFGIGQGHYEDEVGLVAHNSFLHAYTELGFFGGTCFFAMFAYTAWALWRLRDRLDPATHPSLHRLRPYLLAMVVALAAGLFSLSRVYTPSTYLVFGLCAAYLQIVAAVEPDAVPRLTRTLMVRLILLSGLFLFGLHLLTTGLVQWS
jgi:putative inorganic carbon (hco3(-)) transporter